MLLFVVVFTVTAIILAGINRQNIPGGPPPGKPSAEAPPPPTAEQRAEALSTSLLVLAVICVVVGVPAGILVSRNLASPLHDLAEASRAIGGGDLSRRVTLRGTQEIIDVGSAFNQMADDLQHAAELRQNLMADVAHELRTPLTVLQGNLRAILDDVYVMDKEEVTRLYDHTRHLTQLVEDLRIVALAEANQLPLHLGPVDAAKLLTEVWAGFEAVAGEKGVALDLSLPDSALAIRADTDRIRQAVHNLLSNALRHTPTGGEIAIAATSDGTMVTITIRDSGEGIHPGQLRHIFDRFYRGDPARSRGTGGTGLGLAIVKAIVETHRGQVTAYSDGVGKGSAFTLCLPSANIGNDGPGNAVESGA